MNFLKFFLSLIWLKYLIVLIWNCFQEVFRDISKGYSYGGRKDIRMSDEIKKMRSAHTLCSFFVCYGFLGSFLNIFYFFLIKTGIYGETLLMAGFVFSFIILIISVIFMIPVSEELMTSGAEELETKKVFWMFRCLGGYLKRKNSIPKDLSIMFSIGVRNCLLLFPFFPIGLVRKMVVGKYFLPHNED